MGFVKTAKEIARIQGVIEHPRFVNSQMLSIVFDSEADLLASLVPGPLELTAPTVRAMVGRWSSNCVGDYAGGALYLPTRYRDIEGEYVLAMYMTTDAAILYGREVFGEPKKQCTTGLTVNGDHVTAHIERGGTRILELDARLTDDLGPRRAAGSNFNIKAIPSCDGQGLEDDAVLTLAEFDVDLTAHQTGNGTVTLRSTPHDPLGDLPVLGVVTAVWQEGDLFARARRLTKIPAQQFLPYAYGRIDDYSLLNTEQTPAGL